MKNKKAGQLLGDIILELNHVITECDDKEMQYSLNLIDKNLSQLCKVLDIEPIATGNTVLSMDDGKAANDN